MAAHTASSPFDARLSPQGIARLRAVAALVWAGVFAIALGSDSGAEFPVGVGLLVAAYPLIDVLASLRESATGGARSRTLQVNALISGLAVAGLAAAAFATDAGATLLVFGGWAVVSGAIQLAGAARRRGRDGARELPMLISGGLSAIAGISFIASSGAEDPGLLALAGYAALGAVLFLVWAQRARR